MKIKNKDFDTYLVLLLIIAAIFVIYWVTYTIYKYQSFNDYFWDLGQEAYSMYIHLHHPSLVYGLQFLAFSNHISIFKLAILPIFAIYQSPIILVVIQDLALGAAAIVAYLIGRDIVKNNYVGFALGLAFLLNPGIRGIAFFDVHVEAFIPLFFLLSFYFYGTKKHALFLASYTVMLSIVETAPFVGLSLLLALLVYEVVYPNRKTAVEIAERNARLKLLAVGLLITIAFILFYYYVISTLMHLYQMGDYNSMPPFLKIVNFPSIQISALKNLDAIQYDQSLLWYSILWGVLILLFGFGLTGFRNIVITLILVSPWILESVILHNFVFAFLYYHYYAYVVGGAVVAAAMGFMILMRRSDDVLKMKRSRFVRILCHITIVMSIVISVLLLAGLPGLPALLPNNWHQIQNYSEIETALNGIPRNASVMTQSSISSHLYGVLYLELPPDQVVGGFGANGFVNNFNISTFYKRPTYIVLDKQLPDYALFNNSKFNVSAYIGSNYTQYYNSSGLEMYVLNSRANATNS